VPVPVIDIEVLREVGDGDMEFVRELLALFMSEAPQRLRDLRAALEGRSAPAVRDAAHALKGAAACVTARRIAAAASALEQMGRSATLDGAQEACVLLATEVDEFSTVVAALNIGVFGSEPAVT
jgi:HPt (histidine-containing phosphotransfer) domain-containing protein